MNIKNLARSKFYIDLYFPQLRGIDYRSISLGQVSFCFWPRNSFFAPKVLSNAEKSFLRSKIRFQKKFCMHFQEVLHRLIHALRPPEHLQTAQGPSGSFWKHFKKIQIFDLKTRFLTLIPSFRTRMSPRVVVTLNNVIFE